MSRNPRPWTQREDPDNLYTPKDKYYSDTAFLLPFKPDPPAGYYDRTYNSRYGQRNSAQRMMVYMFLCNT